ncbi:MAG: hypothetical protein HY791_01480 [Deltaproteobacteria bacterium]|nr:hypothetical protein [Deltaproteobacteria bacterium]
MPNLNILNVTKPRALCAWAWGLAASCAPAGPVSILPPEGVDYLAAAWFEVDHVVLATGLLNAERDLRIPIDRDEVGSADSIAILGFTTVQLDKAGFLDSRRLSDPIRLAKEGEAALPPASYEGRAAWTGPGSALDLKNADHVRWTVDWLPTCPANACELMPVKDWTLAGHADGSPLLEAVAPVDEHTSIAVGPGAVIRVEEDRLIAWTELSTSAALSDLAVTDDGRIWALADQALLELERPWKWTRRATVRSDARMAADGNSLWMTGRSGVVEHFDGSIVSLVYDARPAESQDTDVAVVAPGHAVAVMEQAGLVVDAAETVKTDRSISSPHSVAMIPKLGLVVVTWFPTQFKRRVEDRWENILTTVEPVMSVHKLWPIGSGFLFGGYNGAVAYDEPGFGVCGPIDLTNGHIRDVGLHNGGLIFVGRSGLVITSRRASKELPVACTDYEFAE